MTLPGAGRVFFWGCGPVEADGDLPVPDHDGHPANPTLLPKGGGGPRRPEVADHRCEDDADENPRQRSGVPEAPPRTRAEFVGPDPSASGGA